jgi:putative endonuclease
MEAFYVYILTTKEHKLLYIWCTNNLGRRLFEHKNKLIDWFTKKYNINKLVYYEETPSIKDGILREKQLKWWTRTKKENLINEINPERKDLSVWF